MSGTRRVWLASALVVLIVSSAAWYGFGTIERFFFARTAEQSESTLRLAASGLRGALRRYEPIPALIADKAAVKRLFADAATDPAFQSVNRELKRIATDVGASDIYVMNANGVTVAASNYDQEATFLGRDFSFRPYFQQAAEGGLGRYFALGTTSLKRGYYFAAPVGAADDVTGVVAVKIEVDGLESDWRQTDSEILVTDRAGVIFMSSRPDWLFKSLSPLSQEALAEIDASRRYPLDELGVLDATFENLSDDGGRLLTARASGVPATFVMKDLDMPEADWTLHILTPTTAATAQATSVFFSVILGVLLIAFAIAFFWQRRVQLMERLASERETAVELERRVRERTADLNEANTQLTQEVGERIDAERRLRKTQTDLIQAGKLAALGQMSAALSHELNQPLAAVKSYADNARDFIDRERTKEARENISRISQLVDRMAEISNHLRNFARKPQDKLGVVPVATVINDALQIMDGRLRRSEAVANVDLPSEELWIVGGQVRLQQVIVNLLSNALDAASAAGHTPHIAIAAHRADDRVAITVHDNGPGLDAANSDQIFDPFFTTKAINEGLGLGLSVSYNIVRDFGGKLSAANHPEGGAIFTIDLEAAERTAGAAE